MKLQINYLALLACVVMHAVLGGLWYGGLFATPWMTMNHMTAASGAVADPGVLPYLYSVFMSIMMALLLAWLNGQLGIRSAMEGARLGLVIGFATILVAFATNYRFSGRPEMLALIDGGYGLVSLTIMGLILGGWQKKAKG